MVALESDQMESVLVADPDCDGCDNGSDRCDLQIEGLELGVVSAAAALSAIGFYLRPPHVQTVREAARRAGVGLTNDRDGGVWGCSAVPTVLGGCRLLTQSCGWERPFSGGSYV